MRPYSRRRNRCERRRSGTGVPATPSPGSAPNGQTPIHLARAMANVEERFWIKVDRSDGCWLWTGATSANPWQRYGSFMPDGRRSGDRRVVVAHRFAYELLVGPIPEGHHVHHVCGQTLCVRPDHLRVVTPAEHRAVSPNHNRNITHCRRGHLLEGDNVRMEGPRRRCRACKKLMRPRAMASHFAAVPDVSVTE